MCRRFRFFSLTVFAAVLQGCDEKPRVAGYSPPDATEQNVAALIERTLENLVFVPGGTYLMGDYGAQLKADDGSTYFSYLGLFDDERPAHEVEVSGFSISKYETSFWEFDLYTAIKGRQLAKLEWFNDRTIAGRMRGGEFPADAPWGDAAHYCKWLAELTNMPFSLPTEAQWEYAARSGGKKVFYATDNGKIERGRNYFAHSPERHSQTFAVGSFPPNPLGLHDMMGNTYEWVSDWYDAKYYSNSPTVNPGGPKKGTQRILRGGGYMDSAAYNYVFSRFPIDAKKDENNGEPVYDYPASGFRCVVNTTEPITPQEPTGE